MRLEKLTIKGLLAFEEAVTLDLRSIPAGSIIAVVGANGSGKSTLMDAAGRVPLPLAAEPSQEHLRLRARPAAGPSTPSGDIDGVPVTTRQEFNPTRRTSKGRRPHGRGGGRAS